MVAYLVACHRDMSILRFPLYPDTDEDCNSKVLTIIELSIFNEMSVCTLNTPPTLCFESLPSNHDRLKHGFSSEEPQDIVLSPFPDIYHVSR